MEDRATKFRKFIEQLPRLCSPTICGTLSQPTTRSERSGSKSENKFEWSLEQKAILSPANITTATCSDFGEMDHSFLHQESEQFFSQKTIAPSPMTTPSTRAYSRSQPAANRFANGHHMMFDERDEDDDTDEENEDDEEDDDDDDDESDDEVDKEQRNIDANNHSNSDTDIDMDVLHDDDDDDNDDSHNDDDDDGQTTDSDGNDTDHYEMTGDQLVDDNNQYNIRQQQSQQRQYSQQRGQHEQEVDDDDDDEGDDEEEEEYDDDEDQDSDDEVEMRTSHHQDMDSLFLSPPLRSSQTQQRVDIFSPETFNRVMDDENTLQSTPKTIGSQIFRTRTRRGSEMSE